MPKLLIVLLSLLASVTVLTPQTLACVNDYVTNHKAIVASRNVVADLTKVELIEPWTTRRDRLRKEVEIGGDHKARNDLASALMHTGDPKTAIQILEEIERTNPGLYRTASNLGTAYELSGDPNKALEWIRKGIERNPESHAASEWLHVRILDKKTSGTKVSNWENDASLLGLNFSNSSKPMLPTTFPNGNSGEPLTLEQVEAGLKYQLHERLQFVKPPDEIVASLLFDLGNIIALKPEGIGMAQGTYELASKYAQTKSTDGQDIQVLIGMRLSMAKMANQKHSFFAGLLNNPVIPVAFVAIVLAISLYVVGKTREFRRRRAVTR